jgi:hypothetical protein
MNCGHSSNAGSHWACSACAAQRPKLIRRLLWHLLLLLRLTLLVVHA